MVEKLLETATLDSENLELNKDRYNISEVLTTVVDKHKMQNNNSDAHKQLAETNAQVLALKERVQTLEAIVTDSSFNVKDEINKL